MTVRKGLSFQRDTPIAIKPSDPWDKNVKLLIRQRLMLGYKLLVKGNPQERT